MCTLPASSSNRAPAHRQAEFVGPIAPMSKRNVEQRAALAAELSLASKFSADW